MKKHLHTALLMFLLLIFSFSAWGKEWPDNPANLLEPFGIGRSGYFRHGQSFKSEGQRIKSWSGGEVIWVSESVQGDGLIVIQHDDGFRSSYRGVEARPDLEGHVFPGEWLGYAGGDSWLFEITDIQRSRIVNPISLLPSRELMPPVSIGKVELVRGTEHLELENETVLSPGRWTVVLNHSSGSGITAIPMEISLYWVGERIGSFRFDALGESEDGTVMETPAPVGFQQIYNSSGELWFPGVVLNAGKGTLELRIRDELGRVVSRSWMLSVR
jgi:hypothetical protein